jgi:hypothetical protein
MAANDLIREAVRAGAVKGWDGFVWMMKIVVPVSLLTTLLDRSGWLARIDFLLQPAMGLLSLPPEAALPLLIGMLANIYGGIAAMVVLPLTLAQMTLVAIFLLTAHNLIQEGIIQAKSGLPPLKATLFRIGAATATVLCVAPFLDGGSAPAGLAAGVAEAVRPWGAVLQGWAGTTLRLAVKIFFIIFVIMILMEILKRTGWVHTIVKICAPFLRLMGLAPKVGLLWMTAVIFGLAYGGAVIVEETRNGDLSRAELETLHLSIGINHSMVEDPILFMALGLSAFWLYIPRLIMAIVTVRLLNLWYRLTGPKPPAAATPASR